MGWLDDNLNPFNSDSILNPFGGGGLFHNQEKALRDDPLAKLVTAPIKSVLAADPLFQKVTTGKWGSSSSRIQAGVHELYSADPVAKNVGVKEKDAVTAAKIAGIAAAAYFTAGAAGSALGGSAGAGGTATGATAAVSGEGGAVASVAGASAGTTTTAAASAALGVKEYAQIAGLALQALSLASKPKVPGGPQDAPDLPGPGDTVPAEQARQTRKNTSDVGRFDTILTGPMGLGADSLGGGRIGRKYALGS